MTGTGEYAATIRDLFEINTAKYGLNQKPLHLSTNDFIAPHTAQIPLFQQD
jgi:hypothetical protein